jgi:hypothetical protein
VLELNAIIFTSFKKRSGLYFWSFTVATWGVAFNATGYVCLHLQVTDVGYIYSTLILLGWCTMITGQSVVLYSRLHIIMHNETRLRSVLIMIITNAIWLHIPIIVLVYGSNSTNPEPFQKPYKVYEKIQLCVFIVQELIISGLYLFETTKLLKLERVIGNNSTRKVLYHLILVNVLVILLDFSILGLEFADRFELQTAWKPLVYSVKLKLEFSILNRLVEMTRAARSGNSYSGSAVRSGALQLGALKTTDHQRTAVADGQGEANGWEVRVGQGKSGNNTLPSTVLKTTEVKVQSHSRRRSETSLAESGKEILAESEPPAHEAHGIERGSASSVSSDTLHGRYENPSWR